MKAAFSVVIIFFIFYSSAQSVSSNEPANSVKRSIDTTIHYTYNENNQTHNYSENWDLDGDGIKDSLFFIGNGGAHLYYHLKIVLSKDKKPEDFNFLMLDMPILGSAEELKKSSSLFPSFVVNDFDGDGVADVYINFDTKFSPIPSRWKRRGLSSHQILIQYKNNSLVVKNFTN